VSHKHYLFQSKQKPLNTYSQVRTREVLSAKILNLMSLASRALFCLTPWMTVTAEDETVVVLNGISDVTPLQLAFESRPLYYLPYLRHLVFAVLLP
jgi:hypothetical protein